MYPLTYYILAFLGFVAALCAYFSANEQKLHVVVVCAFLSAVIQLSLFLALILRVPLP